MLWNWIKALPVLIRPHINVRLTVSLCSRALCPKSGFPLSLPWTNATTLSWARPPGCKQPVTSQLRVQMAAHNSHKVTESNKSDLCTNILKCLNKTKILTQRQRERHVFLCANCCNLLTLQPKFLTPGNSERDCCWSYWTSYIMAGTTQYCLSYYGKDIYLFSAHAWSFPPEKNTSGTFKAYAWNTTFLKWRQWQQQQRWQHASIWLIEPFRLMSFTVMRIKWGEKISFKTISIESLLIQASRRILFVSRRNEDTNQGVKRAPQTPPRKQDSPRHPLFEMPHWNAKTSPLLTANCADSPTPPFQQNN